MNLQAPGALFIGQSPLQVLNLVEAGRAYGMAGPMLVVYDDEAIRRQIGELLARLGVADVRFQRRHLAFRTLFPIILAWRYARLRGRVDTVFFGTYTGWASFLINLVGARRHVLVDDGQKTINIVTAPHTVGLGRVRRGPLSRAFVARAELFTFYQAVAARHGRVARANNLASVTAALMGGDHGRVDPAGPDDIIFIGTHIAHTYGPFESAMRAVKAQAGPRRLLYLMHRRDDAARMQALGQAVGFETMRFDLPLELVFHRLWSTHRPAVWTFGTTATDTLQAMEPQLRVRVYRLERNGFSSARLAEAYEGIYAHYAANPRIDLLPCPPAE